MRGKWCLNFEGIDIVTAGLEICGGEMVETEQERGSEVCFGTMLVSGTESVICDKWGIFGWPRVLERWSIVSSHNPWFYSLIGTLELHAK